MKAILTAAILLIAVACGQSQGHQAASLPSTSASPQPLLFAVLQANGTPNAWTYNTVVMAGLDGRARATATFAPMPVPTIGCIGAIIPQSAHVANGKVFFADGNGVVRSLAIDGTVAVAATFPLISAQRQMLSFAVSPDGTSILGTIYTLPSGLSYCNGAASGTFNFDAYKSTVGGAAQLVYHDSWSSPRDVLALTGWDSVGPIGTYPTVWATQGGGPGSTLGVKVRVDVGTVKAGAVLSDDTCLVWDSIASGSFVCTRDSVITGGGTANQKVNQQVSVRSADGTELWHSTVTGQNSPFGPFLSADGQHLMICCNDLNLSDSHELLVGRDGSQVNLAAGFGASGWLDGTTMVGWTVNGDLAYVASNSPGIAVSMGFSGLFVGTVRA